MTSVPTDEQRMLIESLRGMLRAEASLEDVRSWVESGDSSEFGRTLERTGWDSVGVAEHVGGQGGTFAEVALIAEELGRAAAPSVRWTAMMLAMSVLEGMHQFDRGPATDRSAAWAISIDRPPTQPEFSINGGHIDGIAHHVMASVDVDHLIVPARDGDDHALYHVVSSDPGVIIDRRPMIDQGRPMVQVALASASGRRLVGIDGRSALIDLRNRAAVLTAADSLGASRAMLEMTTAYVAEREQFGVPVGSFQAVKHLAAQMLVDIEPTESIVRHAAWAVATLPAVEAEPFCIAARIRGGEAGARVADAALFLHGAIGFTWEHDLHLFFKRTKLNAGLFGSARDWRAILAVRLDLAGAAA